jgi:hypothetical protein
MYVFTSAIFFLLFFSFFSPKTNLVDVAENMDNTERLEEIAKLEEKLKGDSTIPVNDTSRQRKLRKLEDMKDTTRPVTTQDIREVGMELVEINFSGHSGKYKTVEEYDSIQRSLPGKERDGWFQNRLIKKEITVNEKYRYNPESLWDKLSQSVLHRLPYLLFVSLPLFALILQLLFIRRKQFYYVDHGIFTIHLYIFTFILLLVMFFLAKLKEWTDLGIINWVIVLLNITLLFYLYKGMRNFYGQRRIKTFIKFLLTTLVSLIMIMTLLVIFFFFSAYEL